MRFFISYLFFHQLPGRVALRRGFLLVYRRDVEKSGYPLRAMATDLRHWYFGDLWTEAVKIASDEIVLFVRGINRNR